MYVAVMASERADVKLFVKLKCERGHPMFRLQSKQWFWHSANKNGIAFPKNSRKIGAGRNM